MSIDTTKIRSKLTKLNESLDELESQLEPLLAQSLPETLLALDTLQQAKLQVIIPYVVYDLVFVYLKSRGIDPKTHRVVAELERVRQYFDKVKHAEESNQKKKLEIDKAAAGRFIKHAIAQARNAQLIDEPSDGAPVASSSSNHGRVPIKVTSKMIARAEYENKLGELGSEEDEDLEVFDEEAVTEDDGAMDATDGPPEDTWSMGLDKGKGRAPEMKHSKDKEVPLSRRKRPLVDPFYGYKSLSVVSEPTSLAVDHGKKTKISTPIRSLSTNGSSRGTSVSTSEDREARKAVKKARRKPKRSSNS